MAVVERNTWSALPPELLTGIFQLVIDKVDSSKPDELGETVFGILNVCRHWRSVFLGNNTSEVTSVLGYLNQDIKWIQIEKLTPLEQWQKVILVWKNLYDMPPNQRPFTLMKKMASSYDLVTDEEKKDIRSVLQYLSATNILTIALNGEKIRRADQNISRIPFSQLIITILSDGKMKKDFFDTLKRSDIISRNFHSSLREKAKKITNDEINRLIMYSMIINVNPRIFITRIKDSSWNELEKALIN